MVWYGMVWEEMGSTYFPCCNKAASQTCDHRGRSRLIAIQARHVAKPLCKREGEIPRCAERCESEARETIVLLLGHLHTRGGMGSYEGGGCDADVCCAADDLVYGGEGCEEEAREWIRGTG
jgi:hypothetical protein